jgi:hypothetical protein
VFSPGDSIGVYAPGSEYIYKTVLAASNKSESEHLKCQEIQVDIIVISTGPFVG